MVSRHEKKRRQRFMKEGPQGPAYECGSDHCSHHFHSQIDPTKATSQVPKFVPASDSQSDMELVVGYCGCLRGPEESGPGPMLLTDPESGFVLVAGEEDLLLEYARRLKVTLAGSIEYHLGLVELSLAYMQPLAMDQTAHERFMPLAQGRLNVYDLEQEPCRPLDTRFLLVFPFSVD
jgi:hypothetical protein